MFDRVWSCVDIKTIWRASSSGYVVLLARCFEELQISIHESHHPLLAAALAAFAILTTSSYSDDLTDIKAEVTKRHDEAVKRLQDWIKQPSIAAEDLNYPAGAEYMAKLAKDAGFQQATVINTDGKPGVFATLDAGATKTVGLYFMYDVKQFDPKEWTSPPLEARSSTNRGWGKRSSAAGR